MKMDFVSSTIVGLSKQMNHKFFSYQCEQKFLCHHPIKCSKSFVLEYNTLSIRAFQHLHEDQPILEKISSDDSSNDEFNGQEDMIGPYNVYSTYFDD